MKSPHPESNWGAPGTVVLSCSNEHELVALHPIPNGMSVLDFCLQPNALPLSYEGACLLTLLQGRGLSLDKQSFNMKAILKPFGLGIS